MPRDPSKFRQVTLLTGETMRFDPSEYRAHTNRKEFDASKTQILRVHRHAVHAPHHRIRSKLIDTGAGDHFIVYGRNAVKGGADREVYAIAINESMIPSVVAKVEEACGIQWPG